jgi:hypothetical protein
MKAKSIVIIAVIAIVAVAIALKVPATRKLMGLSA